MPRRPTLFISHGAPSLAIEPGAAADFLAALGARLGRPRAVLCASAHWETSAPRLGGDAKPETIHDFSGFPATLAAMRYPAPGDQPLAARAAGLLRGAGFAAEVATGRGLDHGAWVPLSRMWPDASVPVVELSLVRGGHAGEHHAIGRALAPLRDEDVLIVGSGSASHNLRELAWGGAPPPAWVTAFDAWLAAAIAEGRADDLLRWRERAPHAARNHPTDEHLLPLFVALGAGGDRGRTLHASYTFGALSMACFAFGEDAAG